jgi:uncharacterized membrane protein
MAALAYVLLPLSGALAFFTAESRRVRFHGLQAILYGVAWPVVLFAVAALAPSLTVVVAIGGAIGWAVLILLTAIGADPRIPGARKLFEMAEN